MRWIWLAVAVIAVGCGSSVPESQKTWSRFGVAAESAPVNWNQFVSEGGGFTMNLPPDWLEDDASPEVRQQIRDALSAQIPDFPGLETRQISMSTQFLDGVSLAPDDLKVGIVPTLVVSLQKLKSSLDLADVRKEFEAKSPAPDLIEEIKTPIGTALHIVRTDQLLSLIDSAPIKTKVHTYCLGREKYLWMVKFEIRDGDSISTDRILDAIKSIRLSKPDLDRLSSDYDVRQKRNKDAREKRNREENEEYMRKQDEKFQQRVREEEERRKAEEERLRQEQMNQQQTPPPVEPPIQDPPVQDPPPDTSGG